MVYETKTISDEKELNKIFGIENKTEIPIENNHSYGKYIYDKDIINEYEIRETVLGGLMDIETWNRIKQFERDNPDKIEKWRKEDDEKSNRFLMKHDKKENYKTCEEKVIKICLSKFPKSDFVISVSEYYKRYGKISDKQFSVLKSMIGK